MKLMDTMEKTLQAGPRLAPASISKPSEWPAEFKDPVDAALHVGTPPPSPQKAMPTRTYGPRFYG